MIPKVLVAQTVSYNDMDSFHVDDLRIIESTNTQVRRINVVSAFILAIGRRQLPTEILKREMESWSYVEEEKNEEYRNSTGKLTHNSRPTTSFPRYLQLLSSIKVIRKLGNTISLSSQGKFICNILKNHNKGELVFFEKLIYLDIFLRHDADTVLCIYDMLKFHNKPINQATAQKEFKQHLINRLNNKLKYSSSHIKAKIAERKRVIQIEWKEPESYSEHFIAPRLEWMSDLDIVKKTSEGSNTNYQLTELGLNFLKSFQNDNDFQDFTLDWYQTNFFQQSSRLLKLESCQPRIDKTLVGEQFIKAIDFVETSSTFKLPIKNTLFFVSSSLLILHKRIVEISTLINLLAEGVIVESKIFGIKSSARINEGYITVKLL